MKKYPCVVIWFPAFSTENNIKEYIQFEYRISSYCFRGNYSFLNLEIQRSQYIRPKVTVHKGAETIQRRKLFKGGNYMRKYGMCYLQNLSQFMSKSSTVETRKSTKGCYLHEYHILYAKKYILLVLYLLTFVC